MDLATAAHQAGVTLRRLGQVTVHRVTGSLPSGKFPEVDPEEIHRLAGQLPEGKGGLRSCALVDLAANRPPWHDTGIDLEEGESVTWLAGGRVQLSGLLDIHVGPHFQLWGRIGDGPVFRGTRASHTFRAEKAGRLHLASYFPGEWRDPTGTLAIPEKEYESIRGGLSVVLLRWGGDPIDGLCEVAGAVPHPLLDLEIDRLTNPVTPPEGWRYLWFLGDSEIYTEARGDGDSEIRCSTHCDVGILQHDVDLPFEPGTRLSWGWKVDVLPSTLAEDTLPTHDYLSIAVEFSNGIDITYYWSAELPEETGYWCPLPTWKHREYHVAVRSGTRELGRWIDEDRRLYDDYVAHVGPAPERITRVWLIANSLFQRGRGLCTYRDIRIHAADGTSHAV